MEASALHVDTEVDISTTFEYRLKCGCVRRVRSNTVNLTSEANLEFLLSALKADATVSLPWMLRQPFAFECEDASHSAKK